MMSIAPVDNNNAGILLDSKKVTEIRQNISSQMDPLRTLTEGPLYAQYLNEVRLLISTPRPLLLMPMSLARLT